MAKAAVAGRQHDTEREGRASSDTADRGEAHGVGAGRRGHEESHLPGDLAGTVLQIQVIRERDLLDDLAIHINPANHAALRVDEGERVRQRAARRADKYREVAGPVRHLVGHVLMEG